MIFSTYIVSNSIFLLPFYRLLNKKEFEVKSKMVLDWLIKSKIIDLRTAEVFDGISLSSCVASGPTKFTYTAGTAVGGLGKAAIQELS